jgi:hypothetical protein
MPLIARNGKFDAKANATEVIIPDLNAAVNRKVQGSKPNRGAKFISYELSPPSG